MINYLSLFWCPVWYFALSVAIGIWFFLTKHDYNISKKFVICAVLPSFWALCLFSIVVETVWAVVPMIVVTICIWPYRITFKNQTKFVKIEPFGDGSMHYCKVQRREGGNVFGDWFSKEGNCVRDCGFAESVCEQASENDWWIARNSYIYTKTV